MSRTPSWFAFPGCDGEQFLLGRSGLPTCATAYGSEVGRKVAGLNVWAKAPPVAEMNCRRGGVFPPVGIAALCAFVALTATEGRPQGQVRDPALEVLSGTIRRDDTRELVACHLNAALWGSYDAKVEVGEKLTVDGKARTLEVVGGKLRETPGAEQAAILGLRLERTGRVQLDSSDEAFKKGVPFFITKTWVDERSTVLRYTVVSNPNMKIRRAFAQLELMTGNREVNITPPYPFSSKPQPKERELLITDIGYDDYEHALLSVFIPIGRRYRCLASNEIDLKGSRKPKM